MTTRELDAGLRGYYLGFVRCFRAPVASFPLFPKADNCRERKEASSRNEQPSHYRIIAKHRKNELDGGGHSHPHVSAAHCVAHALLPGCTYGLSGESVDSFFTWPARPSWRFSQ